MDLVIPRVLLLNKPFMMWEDIILTQEGSWEFISCVKVYVVCHHMNVRTFLSYYTDTEFILVISCRWKVTKMSVGICVVIAYRNDDIITALQNTVIA